MFVGVIVTGVIATRTPLHAQQALDAPNVAGSDNMPWNKGITEETRTAARDAFLEGNRLFKIPLFSQAVEKYSEAIDKWKHPAFYFNLAIAQINLGQYLEARENLERALQYGAEPLRADRFEEAKKQLVEVERHLGRIRVGCPTPGAEVTLDGVTLFTGPGHREVWVAVRAHEVTAKKSEYGTQARRVTIAAGKQEDVTLSLRKLVEDRPWATWKPWAVVGTGVAFVAAGGALQALSSRKYAQYDDNFLKLPCASMGCKDDEIRPGMKAQLSRAQLERRLAVGGYIAGGSLIALGTVLVYLNRPHLLEQGAPDARNTIAVVPAFSADTVSVMVTVRR